MTAISVRGLGKQYRRPVKDARPVGSLAWLTGRGEATRQERFWALQDLSFDIAEGEIVGFLGRNGAGKSTLLKILSRITKPTIGTVTQRGRVGTLLEVGTGFHPEMSGRENTFMNGAILGMNRNEVRRKFDEIVAFAGVEDFIDMPVKRYSSGMYLRLAFAVAAHLEPDILIVDEVLAVGDAQFQKKSLDKVRQVSGQGRTVLFVSHNMDTVQSLCTKAMLLQNGRGGEVKDTADVVHEYVRLVRGEAHTAVWQAGPGTGPGDAHVRLQRAAVTDAGGVTVWGLVQYTDELWLEIAASVENADATYNLGMILYDEEERLIFQSFYLDELTIPERLAAGTVTFRVRVPVELLNPGQYRLKPVLQSRSRVIVGAVESDPSVYFDLQGRISQSPHWIERRPGTIAPRLRWHVVSAR